uniref:CUB domain-containing protein n=1 Tax=Arion vulgaris TaxID=1028688 RepID=A0A0B7BI34_9EUPU
MKVLVALLSFLLVAHAFPQFDSDSTPEYVTPSDNFDTEYTTSDYNPRQNFVVECGLNSFNVFNVEEAGDFPLYMIYSNTIQDTTYYNNEDCTIQFVTGNSSALVYLAFETFDLEYNYQCSYDSLCVKGVKFCGNWTDQQYQTLNYGVPAYNTFTLKFTTDSSVIRSGFKIRAYVYKYESEYSAYEPTGIEYAPSPSVLTNFQYRNITDYVDSCSLDNYGVTTPDYYNTDSNAYVTETSTPADDTPTVIECAEGSSTSYYSLYDDYNSNSFSAYPAINTYNDHRYTIKSTNYGNGLYSNNTDCEVKFYTSSSRKLLTLYYSDFEVEQSTGCYFDSVCANGVKFCGDWESGRNFYIEIPAYSWFTFRFNTDSSVSRRGFQAQATFSQTYSEYGTYQVCSGDGSSENTINYCFSSDNAYEDKCASDYVAPAPTASNDEPVYDHTFVDYFTSQPDHVNHNPFSETERNHVQLIQTILNRASESLNYVKDLVDAWNVFV